MFSFAINVDPFTSSASRAKLSTSAPRQAAAAAATAARVPNLEAINASQPSEVAGAKQSKPKAVPGDAPKLWCAPAATCTMACSHI